MGHVHAVGASVQLKAANMATPEPQAAMAPTPGDEIECIHGGKWYDVVVVQTVPSDNARDLWVQVHFVGWDHRTDRLELLSAVRNHLPPTDLPLLCGDILLPSIEGSRAVHQAGCGVLTAWRCAESRVA